MLGKYSDDFEYYEVRAYTKEKLSDEWGGNWDLGYEYAILMDILKWDARTPITEISEKLGKSRPTVRYMINRLKERNILIDFVPPSQT
ncbi:winged helix-turn-helix transcriptional regulator [Thermococcus peptonophilus]|uniref:winged helix-turn-helix transcriptional regulator n=1 Tax=Thermococcus peptonophilus TaxID=53952 RepID=UPI000B1FCD5C